ncbi:hypothetical protein EDB89DRAFT_375554 [Lactarius sanguifluus]|nr:hypothetical protein EDB89DRAFT_375554 [Lactarius sanguifluus]
MNGAPGQMLRRSMCHLACVHLPAFSRPILLTGSKTGREHILQVNARLVFRLKTSPGRKRRPSGSCSRSTRSTRCCARVLVRSAKDLHPMTPTMPFPAVGPGPTSPLVLHGRFPPPFEVHKTSAAQRFIVRPRWPPARLPNQRSRTRRARWSNRRTSFPMMGSVLPLISIPTDSATCHGDPPLTQTEELTKVYNIFNTTPEFMGVLALSTGHLLKIGRLPVRCLSH